MALNPRLLIIGERYTCSTTKEWLERLTLLYSYLPLYPDIALQVRSKSDPSLLLQARNQLPHHPRCIFNTSLKQARQFDWTPIHLPENELTHTCISREFGASVHSTIALQKGISLGASYLIFGPVFTPRTKSGVGVGLNALKHICSQSSVPILAIGGITPQNTASVLVQGAYGVASAGWIMQATNPKQEIEQFLSKLQS